MSREIKKTEIMDKIPMCPNCGNTKSGEQAKKCARCGKITCYKCSFTGCTCGSMSVHQIYKIGK